MKYVKQGSPHAVHYVLQMPSGLASSRGGQISVLPRGSHPLLNSKYYLVILEDLLGYMESARSNLPQVTHSDQKRRPFRNVVVIESAQVASANLGDASTPVDQYVGEISYNFVSRVDSMSLKVKVELQEFARILVSALKWTLTQH